MRLLLVEDDLSIAKELQARWQGEDWIVRHADTLAAADQALGDDSFDVVVLDLGLPDGDGLEWLRVRRKQAVPLQVLVSSARGNVSDRVLGLQVADDYVTKPYDPEELEARIERLMSRAQNSREQLFSVGKLTLSKEESSAFVEGRRLELPPREYEVLELLARRSPSFVVKADLVRLLAQSNPDATDSSVELYVSRLRKQLGGSGIQILTIRGVGYQLRAAGAA